MSTVASESSTARATGPRLITWVIVSLGVWVISTWAVGAQLAPILALATRSAGVGAQVATLPLVLRLLGSPVVAWAVIAASVLCMAASIKGLARSQGLVYAAWAALLLGGVSSLGNGIAAVFLALTKHGLV